MKELHEGIEKYLDSPEKALEKLNEGITKEENHIASVKVVDSNSYYHEDGWELLETVEYEDVTTTQLNKPIADGQGYVTTYYEDVAHKVKGARLILGKRINKLLEDLIEDIKNLSREVTLRGGEVDHHKAEIKEKDQVIEKLKSDVEMWRKSKETASDELSKFKDRFRLIEKDMAVFHVEREKVIAAIGKLKYDEITGAEAK